MHASPRPHCPTCRAEIVVSDGALSDALPHAAAGLPRYFPFCSQRCKMVDLGRWFNEDYKITRPIQSSDIPDSLPADGDEGE
jgi:uncharacterized protein